MNKSKKQKKKGIIPSRNIDKQKRQTLSVCMIVKNEASRIKRAIESVKPFADEIVVVDTGSEDNTAEIAQRLGAKVSYFEWCDDFSAARNASLDMATGDWIMWLDADDYVPSTEWPKLIKIKQMPPNQGLMVRLKNEGWAKEICWQLRLFPNNPKIRFIYPVHEQIAPSLKNLDIPMNFSDITIIHTGYEDSETVAKKRAKSLQILKGYLEQHPYDAPCRFNLGFTYLALGMYDQAILEFTKIIESQNMRNRKSLTYFKALLYLGRAHLHLGLAEKALQVLREAYLINSSEPLLRVSLAISYNLIEEPQEALGLLDGLDSWINTPSPLPVDLEALQNEAKYHTAIAFEKLGNLQKAIEICCKALKSKSFDEYKDYLGYLVREICKTRDGSDVIAKLARGKYSNAELCYEYANILLRRGDLDEAERQYRQALRYDKQHCRAGRALAALLKRTGRKDEAIRTLEAFLECENDNEFVLHDLVDLLFEQEKWKEILGLGHLEEILPTRVAVQILSGIDEGLNQDILSLFRQNNCNLSELDNLGIGALWKVAKGLDSRQKFHLAVACFSTDPSFFEPAQNAVEGFIEKGMPEKALEIAEKYVRSMPTDTKGFELLAASYRAMGIPQAAEICLGEMKRLAKNTAAKCSGA